MKPRWFALAVVLLGLVGALSLGLANFSAPLISLTGLSGKFSEFTPSNGELSLYLVGSWDVRKFGSETSHETRIQLINPQPQTLFAFVAFFDDAENPLRCDIRELTANDFDETIISGPIDGKEVGVVKIVSTNTGGLPEIGLVGYKKEIHLTTLIQRLTTGGSVQADVPFVSESRLQPVPTQVLAKDTDGDGVPDELSKIKALCEPS
jgi:hypothetical protein